MAGEITHVEIPADDIQRAMRFYEAVVGWQFQAAEGFSDYYVFRTSDQSGGAIGRRGESVGTVIRDYITVDRLEDAVRAAEEHGGRQVVGPTEVAQMGRYAVVHDPDGNEIGLWENLPG